jgi:hypothetical protein
MAKVLLYKPMLIKVMTWELNDRTGNWVVSVAPRKGAVTTTETPVVVDDGLHADVPW